MRVAIYGARRQGDHIGRIATFFDSLAAGGAEVVIHHRIYDSLMSVIPTHLDFVTEVIDGNDFTADVVVSFGGDGTFLRTAMWVGEKELPIFGINTGHLGYLTSATTDDLGDVAREILSGDYTVESRSLIHVASPGIDTWPYALNEVVVSKYETASMITADAAINGRPLASYRADGLIISTPTGSTAYNLSVGGPLIQPSAPVWVLSPISAHTLSMRPLVVSDDSLITVACDSRASGFRLTLDGRWVTLPVGTSITLVKAPFAVHPVCRPGHEFPGPLRSKLMWG